MFWLLDLYYKNKVNTNRSKKFRREFLKYDESCLWIVFLPWKTSIERAEKFNLIPKEWIVIVYEWPYNLVSYIPHEMPEAQKIISNDLNSFLDKNKNILPKIKKILWISQWIYPAFYVANNIVKVDKFIVCTPAWKWEEALWYSKVTTKILEKAEEEWYSFNDYKKILKEWNPWNNIKNLPEDIEVHYWVFDRYIVKKLPENFIKDIEKTWKKPKVFKYRFTGHYWTIYLLWRYIKKNYFWLNNKKIFTN